MRALVSSAVLAAAVVVATAAPAAAQETAAARQARPAQAEWTGDLPRHFEGITLTSEQKGQIAELQKRFHARMDALRDSAKAAGAADDAPELRRRLGGIMTEEHEAFKALLDEEGRRRFDANMAKMHGAEHGSGHDAGQGAAHGAGHGAGQGAGHGSGNHGAHGSGRPPAR